MFAAALLVSCAASQTFGRRPQTAFVQPVDGEVWACADFDGDGLADLAVVGAGLSIHRNVGGGRFSWLSTLAAGFGTVRDVAAADFDGDGDQDLMVDGVAFENDGVGGFAQSSAMTPSLGGAIVSLHRFFDRDGDGDLDMVLLVGGLMLFDNDGAGQWTDVTGSSLVGATGLAGDLAVFDVDGDGDLDIVAAPAVLQVPEPTVFVNDGTGRLARQAVLPPVAGLLTANLHLGGDLRVGDFTGDGVDDVMMHVTSVPNWATVVFVRGAGGWTVRLVGQAPGVINSAVADWDGDGRADIVTSTALLRQVGVLQFEHEPWLRPFPASRVRVADADGDGVEDVVGADGVIFHRADGGVVYSELEYANGSAIAEHLLDVRRTGGVGASARLQLLYLANTTLWFATDAPGSAPGSPRILHSPPAQLSQVRDACFHQLPNGTLRAAVCRSGVFHQFELQGDELQSVTGPAIPGFVQAVVAAELDGSPGDELVVSDAVNAGPRIYTWQAGAFVDISPTLPLATASGIPAYDDVVLADVDGDGDLDILYELRVVENLGGAWQAGASFASLMPAAARHVEPLDFDGDGDDDLYVATGGLGRLLESTPNGFVDVTAARMPGTPSGPFELVPRCVADVDGDGDPDLVLASSVAPHVLRNDAGTFVPVPVGASGVPVDVDGDGRTDVFTGREVHSNLHTFLSSRHAVLVGGSWSLRMESWRVSSPVVAAWAVLGSGETRVPIAGVGDLRVSPVGAVLLSLAARGGGEFDASIAIPAQPALVGAPLFAQALALDAQGLQFGSLVREHVR